ncbi:MAG: RcpC/CpaB family pilus assembly protein [Streptosporangiaceae bacterium]
MKRRVLTALLAALLAVLGTAGVLAYVRQADARAIAGQQAVTVLAAKDLIPSGTSAAAALRTGLLVSQELPASSVPSDAVRSITPALQGLVLSAELQPGQLLLRPMLVTAARTADGIAIPAGMVAVTIQLCPSEAVADSIHAGSQVAVFGTYAPKASSLSAEPNCDLPHQQQAYGGARTRIVLPRVLVLSTGTASASGQARTGSSALAQSTSGTSASSPGLLVTVAVSQASAGRLIQLAVAGLPYLALLSDSSQASVATRPVPPAKP